MLTLLRCAVAAIASLVVLASAQAQAQSLSSTVRDPQELINWYYAATFGTGVYTSGDRSVSVLQVPFSRALKTVDEDGTGLRFKISTTLGFYDYDIDSVFGGNIPDRISTLSVLSGLEWELPLNRHWTIRPYFDGGFGQELDGSESAWIYDFGVKSRFLIVRHTEVEFALVNSLTAAGYRPRGGPTQPFGYLATGLDITIPTERRLFGRVVDIGFTPVYYYYFGRLNFAEFSNPENRLGEEFQLALSIVTRKPWSLKVFAVDRVGLAIRTSSDVSGVSLFTSLPF
ncbi:MAG: hypothetical protein H7X76_10240 [Prolixibacteraceae bacterium]|nr:hypothetical protein [Burkholderiales bacterium]